jgi:hypothetical protein
VSVDQQALLKDLQRQVRSLEDDVRRRAVDNPEVAEALRVEHSRAVELGRTATSFTEWRDTQVTQSAVAWVLATVFVRFCEDNGLVDEAWLSGPGDRRREAGERRTGWLIRNSDRNDRDWLLESFSHLAAYQAVSALFDRRHNPLYRLPVSADGAEALIAFWQRASDDGRVLHDFTDPDLSTRFLGDLYQDLSEAARKQYALLQTPEFVEELILDLTLDPAIETFGLDGLRLIDPTCGSGHFLLGAFHRLLDRWGRERPGTDLRQRVQAALDSVHGVDVNPFATAIARFRLTVAAMRASGLRRLADAPGYDLHVATGDSLLYEQGRQGELFESGLAEHQYASEDLADHPGILSNGTYHVVVGNPPYITVKDKALNDAYRGAYPTCHRQYALSVPFAELFFRLAMRDHDRPGYVGQITSNSFMKREFGKKLIEEFLPTVDLSHVIDTSGAYIPGHGTPTVVLVGRRRHPRSQKLRAVLGIRGEPSAPAEPAKGLVWRSIVEHLEEPGFEDEFVSVTELPRTRLASHPWSLSGGGADALLESLTVRPETLKSTAAVIGFGGVTREDDAYALGRAARRRGVPAVHLRRLVDGERVRDWRLSADEALWPYSPTTLDAESDPHLERLLWPNRTYLRLRPAYGQTQLERGLEWFEYSMFFKDRFRTPMSITFAFVATHNHFVLDRGGKVFNRSAPVIKLPEGATEDDHLALLGLLNSSTACFWLKQVSYPKGGDPVGDSGARVSAEGWDDRYEFTGTKLQEFPLLDELPTERARALDGLARRLSELVPESIVGNGVPTREMLDRARTEHESLRGRMIASQEELDWWVYKQFGLVDEDLTFDASEPPCIVLGERAFEIALARRVDQGLAVTTWFERHGSAPTTEVPEDWPAKYREVVERRLAAIEGSSQLRLIERADCKRRWAAEPWEVREKAALRGWLLDRLEQPQLWRDSTGRPQPQSVAQLADRLAADADFLGVLDLWTGRSGSDVTKELSRLLTDEHVPFLAALRYQDAGLRTRAEWERTWELQRREDVGEQVGPIAVPPKYKPADFVKTSYWRHRGKLDVPKERFISYPGAERGADATLVLGWAGWDHAEQALALAALALNRTQTEAWGAERLTPLWAGVAELEPWVRQWHSEVDPRMGTSPAQAVGATLERELSRLGLTRDDLAAWRPAPAQRGRRAAPREGSS